MIMLDNARHLENNIFEDNARHLEDNKLINDRKPFLGSIRYLGMLGRKKRSKKFKAIGIYISHISLKYTRHIFIH